MTPGFTELGIAQMQSNSFVISQRKQTGNKMKFLDPLQEKHFRTFCVTVKLL